MATTAEIMANWQASQQQPTLNNSPMYGQTPQMSIAGPSIMAGFGQNQNPINPSTGLRFEDPTGSLGMGTSSWGMSVGDIGKNVAYAPWGQSGSGVGGFGVGTGGTSGISGFGLNMPTFALGLQGLNTLGSLYMGGRSLNLANEQFKSAQRLSDINLTNQTHGYNDRLTQQIERSGKGSGATKEQMDAEIARRKLPTHA